jgi:hypothetical protein
MEREDVYGDPGGPFSGESDVVGGGDAVGPKGPFTGPTSTDRSVNRCGEGLRGAGSAAGVSGKYQF